MASTTGIDRGDLALVRFVLTNEGSMVESKLGALAGADLGAVEASLRSVLGL